MMASMVDAVGHLITVERWVGPADRPEVHPELIH